MPVIIICLQLVIGLLVAGAFLIVGLFGGWAQTWSSVLATMVVVVPNAFFARVVSGPPEVTLVAGRLAEESRQDAALVAGLAGRRILLHQVWKVVFTLVLMVGAFTVFQPRPLGFFTTLIALQLAYVLGPLWFDRRMSQS